MSKYHFFFLILLCGITANISAQIGNYTTISVPGESVTRAIGINNVGDIVGTNDGQSGFRLRNGIFTPITFPGSVVTDVYGINDSGVLAGTYYKRINGATVPYGFTSSGGNLITIGEGYACGINNAGDIVGYDRLERGFKLSNGNFTPISYPGARSTFAYGINNLGDVVGHYSSGKDGGHAFKLSNGVYTNIDFPGSEFCEATGINDAGVIVGDCEHGDGFKLSNGTYTAINFPGAYRTIPIGINNSGEIVGYYTNNGTFGFKLTNDGPEVTNVLRSYSGVFLKGFDANNDFDVRINWKGSPGRVRFQINDNQPFEVGGNAAGAIHPFKLNKDFPFRDAPSKIKITPINGEGVTGITKTEEIYVFDYPTWLQTATQTNPSAITFSILPNEMKANFNVKFPTPEFQAKTRFPDSVPFVGGEFGISKAQGTFSGYVSSLGTGNLTLSGETKFKGLGQELSGSASGNGDFLLDQNGLSVQNASFKLGLEGTLKKEVSLITAIPALAPFRRFPAVRRFTDSTRLRGELKPSVNFSATWKQDPTTRELIFNEGTGTIGLEMRAVLNSRINDHFRFQGWVAGGGDVTVGTPSPFLRELNLNLEAGAQLNIDYLFGATELKATADYKCNYTAGSEVSCSSPSSFAESLKVDNRFNPKVKLIRSRYDRFGYQEFFRFLPKDVNEKNSSSSLIPTINGTIVSNVFAGAEPVILPVGSNGKLMLWVRQNTSLPVLQSTEIAWSYFDGINWSTPAVITQDSRAEFSPVAGVDQNGKVVAAWLKIKTPAFDTAITTFDDLPLFYKQVEVVSAVFNPVSRTWSNETSLTNDSALDTSLRLAKDNNGKLLLTWQSNPNGEFTADSTNPATLKYSFWNGTSWNAPAVIASDLSNAAEHTAAVKGNNAFVVLPVDPNPDVENDSRLLVYNWNGTSWSSANVFAGGTVDNQLPNAVYDSTGQGNIIWRRGADLVQATLSNATPRVVRAGSESAAFYNLQLLNNNLDNLTLIWQETVDNGPANIFAKVYYPGSGLWSDDRRLNNDERQSKDAGGYYDNSGNLHLAYLATQILRVTKTVTIDGQNYEIPNVPENGQTDLNLLTVNQAPTAGTVSIAGRVIKADGNGISKATVSLTDSFGNVRTTLTNPFGYYSFNDVAVGSTYVVSVRSKRFEFANQSQVLSVMQESNEINFTALP